MFLYYDQRPAPPVEKERKHRQRAGTPLTAIGNDGYFIPLRLINESAEASTPVPPALPAAPTPGLLAWLRREAIDHLIPWDRKFLTGPLLIRAGGLALEIGRAHV